MNTIIQHKNCEGSENFIRAGGNIPCPVCKEPYKCHPYCSESQFALDHKGRPLCYLQVLCDGTHVKL